MRLPLYFLKIINRQEEVHTEEVCTGDSTVYIAVAESTTIKEEVHTEEVCTRDSTVYIAVAESTTIKEENIDYTEDPLLVPVQSGY